MVNQVSDILDELRKMNAKLEVLNSLLSQDKKKVNNKRGLSIDKIEKALRAKKEGK
jgi:hypothetical protein